MKKVDNQNKYDSFRKDYRFFEFQSYSFQIKNKNLEVVFSFNLSKKYFFSPRLTFQGNHEIDFEKVDPAALDALVFHIGMVELISYWKAACPPRVVIRPHKLAEHQIKWWKKLYFHGLGEFFYLNGIETDMERFMHIVTEGADLPGFAFEPDRSKVIVPIGGGKDSVVTLELLKDSGKKVLPLLVNPRPANVRTVEAARCSMKDSIVINRTLDPLLLELNDRGFLNGHTPFSALLAFIGALSQVASGAGYIALSNESSASQSTVPGTMINHQYSKSVEFEEDFISYVQKYLHPEIKYFSFLRPLNELQIAKLFSGFPWHYSGFRSCNVGSKNDTWCGKCPKCLFTFIILSPFISQNRLEQIFGRNLLEDDSLENVLDELTGKAAVKPFECIGTPDEVRGALWHLAARSGKEKRPVLLKNFLKDFPLPSGDSGFQYMLKKFDIHHFPETEFKDILKNALAEETLGFEKYFQKIIENKKILILGFGREGRSTYRLIRRLFPLKKLGIADMDNSVVRDEMIRNDKTVKLHLGENHQKTLDDYDLIFKSPGVKLGNKENSSKKITSQTAVFLEYYRDRTIGVTGTKGKSTTVSLIQHFLQQAGRKTVLLGNIGLPAFDAIGEIDFDTVIIFEMSAHQLEDIKVSPHVSVLLKVYPEHLDHFISFDLYRQAKANIYRYQIPGDVLLVEENEKTGETTADKKLFGKSGNANARIIRDGLMFKNEKFLIDTEKIPLKGEHNLLNIMAAMMAADEYGVDYRKAFSALKTFKGLPHRLEYAGNYGGIDFYNDSISTVPQSTMAAVKTIPGIDTLLLGGYDRGLDYRELVEFLKITDIRNFIFLGKAGEEMERLFRKPPATRKSLFRCANLPEAFEIIAKHTKKGKACLLSPAAASYDQFHNFEHRGDAFKELAKGMEKR